MKIYFACSFFIFVAKELLEKTAQFFFRPRFLSIFVSKKYFLLLLSEVFSYFPIWYSITMNLPCNDFGKRNSFNRSSAMRAVLKASNFIAQTANT